MTVNDKKNEHIFVMEICNILVIQLCKANEAKFNSKLCNCS